MQRGHGLDKGLCQESSVLPSSPGITSRMAGMTQRGRGSLGKGMEKSVPLSRRLKYNRGGGARGDREGKSLEWGQPLLTPSATQECRPGFPHLLSF